MKKRMNSGYLKMPEAPQRENDLQETISGVGDYQVFLSFRGPDSRQSLADVLCNDMNIAGICVFRDDDELGIGDEISKILLAIKNSKICVPIFSRTFAASTWCLREVERMVDLKKRIMPIFYTASLQDVKLSTELFKKDLRKHEKKHGRDQVKKWEDALKAVARIKGREVKSTGYAEFSKLFVRELLIKLKVTMKYVTNFLIKRDDQEDAVMKLLDIDASDVRLVSIHGMGGIGKTTLAKVVFNQLTTRFDCCSFLENVQELLKCNGLEYLQKQLVGDLSAKLKYFQSIDSMIILKEYFCRKKVLIVLDDINKRKQIEMIIGMLGWFGPGSRIIVTTRDRRVLAKESWAFAMQELNHDQALQLFSRHAFGEDSPPRDYHILSNEVLSLTGGLPLALEVIGSLLRQCESKRWRTVIEKLKKVPNRDVQEKLRISVNELDYEQKQIFLDIACFFVNKEISSANYMWDACDFYPDDGLEVLVSMSLVQITEESKLRMHDLIRDLGRELVREECFSDPTKRSRIWSGTTALEVLKIKQGKEKVEGLFLENPADVSLTHEEFSGFQNLRLLKLVDTNLEGNFELLLSKLKWFSWHCCPSHFTMVNLSLKKLVVLDLSQSSINENWAGWSLIQMAKNLKVLDLTRCCNLTSTLDLSNNNALERLILSGCCNLARTHISIGKLKRLKHLDLRGCYSLRGFQEELSSLEDLEEILVDGSGNTFHLPESIGNLPSLSTIILHKVEITRIPDSIGRLVNLTRLSLRYCTGIEKLPDVLGDLRSLVELDLAFTKLSALPSSIRRLVKLQLLCLEFTEIKELPDVLGDLTSLGELDLSCTKVCLLPNSVGQLVKLHSLRLPSTKIEELPDSLKDLKSLEILDLSSSQLSILPDFVGDMAQLEQLSLQACKIRKLPNSIGKLTKLETLNVSSCNVLTGIPVGIGNLSALRTLRLRDSQIAELSPRADGFFLREGFNIHEGSSLQKQICHSGFLRIDNLTKLRKLELNLSGLTTLPSNLGGLTQLYDLQLCCSGLKCIPQLPSSLNELELSYVTTETKLPNFSNLKNLWSIKFIYCSTKDEPESLRDLQRLKHMVLTNCTRKLVEFSFRLENLSSLAISAIDSSVTLLDLSCSINLKRLVITFCKELTEIRGLGDLKSLMDLTIQDCHSLESVGSLSELKSLCSLKIEQCSLLRDIEGIDSLFLKYLRVSGCKSIANIDKLKKKCRMGYFNGLEVKNYG